MESITAQAKATELLALLKQKVIAEERVKSFNKKIFSLQQELTDAMSEENVTSIEIEDVKFKIKDEVNFSLQNTTAKKWIECDEFINYLKKNEDEGIITSTINAQTLKAYLKRKLENDDELPDIVKINYISLVNWNKSQIERMAKGA